MIDVARALVTSECQLKYSIIFVAFDKEEVGIIMLVLMVILMSGLTKSRQCLFCSVVCYRLAAKAATSSFEDFSSQPCSKVQAGQSFR